MTNTIKIFLKTKNVRQQNIEEIMIEQIKK